MTSVEKGAVVAAEYEVTLTFKVPVKDSEEAYSAGEDIADWIYKKMGFDSYDPKVVERD